MERSLSAGCRESHDSYQGIASAMPPVLRNQSRLQPLQPGRGLEFFDRAGFGGPTRIRTWNQQIMSLLL
jgi:hypothetical protein